jgi:hypothetical protein
MVIHQRTALVVGILALAVCGCSRATNETLEPGIMNEAEHSHYHVHAVDASHEHAHPDLDAFGGHTHSHKHSHNDPHL